MKHVIFTLSLLALVSCKDSKNQDVKTETVEHPADTHNNHDTHEASGVYANAWVSEIQIDNGDKWQADATTNEGVQKLQNTINTQTASTLDDYHKLAEQLNDEKNFVVKNCTMKGPSHDNLHIWLHPLIEKIDALLKTEDVDDSAKITVSIKENINAYNTYFQ
ncbi:MULTISPECIES: hypothetical protein [Bizionia]|uniref:Uncharacterized protein n=1 Tax=Bizionia algoritergicola TaxID=291187 RepID=A0A5D0QXQ6_9FLAO|nr:MULTISPECIES: hypothetical protein [Bizionia]OBX24055.1 hypothetical protein BAA08_01575 [Bizionia sp. APA-3]TYB73565.1 hypothetical protein ES675_07880 [Bizionia algoritergicola]